jgi:AcrR family transcriptional regulator
VGGGGEPPDGSEAERFDPSALAGLPPALALTRLPPGRHGLPRSLVAEQQRLRIVAAMLRVLPRHGYPATTIGHLTAEAGVSRAAFYAHFDDKEGCFLATHDLAAEWLCERVERAVPAGASWPERARAGAAELEALLVANPAVTHLLAVEDMRAGEAARERHRALLARLAAAVRADLEARPGAAPELEQMLLDGALSLVARHLETDRAALLPEAMGSLVESLLIPYLDPRNAGATLGSSETRRSKWQRRP